VLAGLHVGRDNVDWEEVAAFVIDSYLMTAPRHPAALVEQ
jgi:hypothetical protein